MIFEVTNILNTKINSDRNKALSIEEYLNKIGQYLKDIINNLKKSGTWQIQLTISNNFIFSIDNDEEHVIHSKSDNIELVINDEADEVIKKNFHSLKNRYQKNLQSMKGSEFFFFIMFIYFIVNAIN